MVPNIVFAPNIHRTQNTDTGRKTQTQLISALVIQYSLFYHLSEEVPETISYFVLPFVFITASCMRLLLRKGKNN